MYISYITNDHKMPPHVYGVINNPEYRPYEVRTVMGSCV